MMSNDKFAELLESAKAASFSQRKLYEEMSDRISDELDGRWYGGPDWMVSFDKDFRRLQKAIEVIEGNNT